MASLEPGTTRRWVPFKAWRPMALAAFALGVLAFILAQWPPVHRATGVGDLETVSMGLNLLIAGGLPWFLQWASLAILFALLVGRLGYLDLRTTVAVVLFPLAVGACWWIGVAVTHWHHDPLDFLANSVMWSISRGFGAETLAQTVLFEVLGPLTCPLMLRGPYVLAGWTFLWTALSTTLVLLLFAWTARKLATLKHLRLSGSRRLALVGAVVLIYDLPVLLRGVIRVVSSL
jgi:hypothetical protein